MMDIIKLKDYKNIFYVDTFFDEYAHLFAHSRKSHEKCLFKLRTNLKILDGELLGALQYQQFEKLVNEPFYSIRHVSKINPRVIFAFVSDGGNIILLSSCKENNKSDYRKAVEQARYRMNQLEELI